MIIVLLHLACLYERIEKVQLLLDYGAKESINLREQQQGFTCLMIACQSGKTDVVELLLKNGSNPDLRGDDGQTVANIALVNFHFRLWWWLRSYKQPSQSSWLPRSL